MFQTIIALTGLVSVALLLEGGERRRWVASVVGLIGQPFWLVITWQAQQWGMFVVSVGFCVVWVRGLRGQ